MPAALVVVGAACSSDGTGASDVLAVARVDITPSGAGLVPEATQQFIAVPKTSSGISVPNRSVTWSSSNPGVASVSESGLVTAHTLGEVNITAEVDGVEASVPVNVSPKPVASIEVIPTSVTLFVSQSQQLEVTLKDAQGGTLTGRTVTFTSDDNQVASVSQGLITAVGPGQTVVHTRSEGKEATTNVTVAERPAVSLDFTVEPTDAVAGQLLTPVKVAIRDETGATVTGATDAVTLSLENHPDGASLSGTVTVNAVGGVATFSDLRINQSGTGYTLSATSGTLTPDTSEPFDVAPGAPAALAIVTQPSSTAVPDEPLASQPAVRLVDAQGNPVAHSGTSVIVALQPNGPLGGTNSAETDAQGVARFSGLSIGTEGTYRMVFLTSGLSSVTSDEIVVGDPPPAAAQLQVAVQPSGSALSTVTFETQPEIQLADENGAPVNTSGVSVTAQLATGGGSLLGTKTIVTNNNGRAVFTDLAINGSGTHTIRFTAAGLTEAVSDPIEVIALTPTKLGFLVPPGSTTASGQVFSPAPQVQLLTAENQAVPQAGVPVASAVLTWPEGAAPSLSGANVQTDASGVATFANLVLTGPPGDYTLTFTSSGLVSITSGSITIPGPAKLLLNAFDPVAKSGELLNPAPQLTVLDAAGHPVPGVEVVVTASDNVDGLQGATTRTTNSSGVVTFTNLRVKADAGPHSLTFSVKGFPGVPPITTTITIEP